MKKKKIAVFEIYDPKLAAAIWDLMEFWEKHHRKPDLRDYCFEELEEELKNRQQYTLDLRRHGFLLSYPKNKLEEEKVE